MDLKKLLGIASLLIGLLYVNSASAQQTCQAGVGVQVLPPGLFTNSVAILDSSWSAPGCPILTITYDMGDGTILTGQPPLHTYNQPGTYTVCQVITTACGCIDSFCTSVTVSGSGNPGGGGGGPGSGNCSTSFTQVQVPGFGTAISMTGQGGLPPYHYIIDWGDGSVGPSFNTQAIHTYANPGGYNVCITRISSDSCVATYCDSVFSNGTGGGGGPLGCLADFFVQQNGSGTVSFVNRSFGSGPLTYQWTIQDSNTLATYNTMNPTHTFANPGFYITCLVISDTSGCTDSICHPVFIQGNPGGGTGGGGPRPCSMAFFSIDSGTSVDFIALANTPAGISTIFWDFGDSSVGVSQGPFINHNYAANGTYVVCATMITQDSCVSTFCDSVVVGPPANPTCQASFWYAPSGNIFGGPGGFLNWSYSNDVVVGWHWDFGNGDTSNLRNPGYSYQAAGSYNVCLTMTTAGGCTDTYCDTVVVHPPSINLWANLYHFTTVTPGFPLWVHLSYGNSGSLTAPAGDVTYRYPAGVDYSHAVPAPTTIDTANRLLTWSWTNLTPHSFGGGFIRVTFNTDTFLALGTATFDTVWINPFAGDIDTSDNICTVIDTVVGSWDPNDKGVVANGTNANGNINPNTTHLTYLVRFQNTGTAPAVNVVIRDTLDGHLDIGSFTMLDASHQYTMDIEQGNIAVWRFNNIYLPDSNSNEPESHGYVNYQVKLNNGLPLGTQIHNTAAIYFDFNAPVITNTVTSTLFQKTVGIETIFNDLDLMMVPNPSAGIVNLQADESITSVRVYDLAGQELNRLNDVNEQNIQLNLGELANGTYLIQVQSENSFTTEKLVIQR